MAISDGIVPGTVAYGDRENLAAALDTPTQDTPSAPAATSGSAGVGGPMDPLQAMLGGNIPTGGNPVTSGLSVGPGNTPGPTQGQMNPMQERLVHVALNAKSPQLRAFARQALRKVAYDSKVR